VQQREAPAPEDPELAPRHLRVWRQRHSSGTTAADAATALINGAASCDLRGTGTYCCLGLGVLAGRGRIRARGRLESPGNAGSSARGSPMARGRG
jgi:hypothetical protein